MPTRAPKPIPGKPAEDVRFKVLESLPTWVEDAAKRIIAATKSNQTAGQEVLEYGDRLKGPLEMLAGDVDSIKIPPQAAEYFNSMNYRGNKRLGPSVEDPYAMHTHPSGLLGGWQYTPLSPQDMMLVDNFRGIDHMAVAPDEFGGFSLDSAFMNQPFGTTDRVLNGRPVNLPIYNALKHEASRSWGKAIETDPSFKSSMGFRAVLSGMADDGLMDYATYLPEHLLDELSLYRSQLPSLSRDPQHFSKVETGSPLQSIFFDRE